MEYDNSFPPPPPAPPAAPQRPRTGLGRRTMLAATALGLMTGAFAGGFVITHAATTATPSATASPSTGTTTPAAGTTTPAAGTFKPNEDATHEAGESAAREAQENAGQVPTVP